MLPSRLYSGSCPHTRQRSQFFSFDKKKSSVCGPYVMFGPWHIGCGFTIRRVTVLRLSKMARTISVLVLNRIVCLCLSGYLVCTKPGPMPTDFRNGIFVVNPEDKFWASPKTDQLLEERFQRRWQWIVPTVISALALIISAIALILSLTQGPTEVYISNWPQG